MQTFLPYPDFERCAAVLDRARLGKQRVEVLQILRALRIEGYGWRSHPVVRMWRGCTEALVAYGLACSREWTGRGHPDTCEVQIAEFAAAARTQAELAGAGALPAWLGDGALHRSHQSALVRKDPAYYRPLFPDVPDALPYVWPDVPAERAAEPAPFSAWVVRATDPRMLGMFVDAGVVALEPEDGAGPAEHLAADEPPRRARKRHRIIERFVEDMREGDPVVVPTAAGQRLLVGRVAGEYRFERVPPSRAPLHVRSVSWAAFAARSSLRDPAALQDPQLVFPVHGEQRLITVAGAPG